MPYYSFEMVLVGIILLSAMSFAGIQIWIKKKNDSGVKSIDNNNQKIEYNKDL